MDDPNESKNGPLRKIMKGEERERERERYLE